MNYAFTLIIFYFILYSTLGWVCETTYCSAYARKLINRGFLTGPYCPIYGAGALVVLLISSPIAHNPIALFLVSIIATTTIEYFVSWLLEKIFHIRWWDYSNEKMQLNGRICLKNSILFGLLSLFTVYVLHPQIHSFIEIVSDIWLRAITNGLLVIFSLDLLMTLNSLLRFIDRLHQLQHELVELKKYSEKFKWFNSKDLEESLAQVKAHMMPEESKKELISKLESIIQKRQQSIRYLKIYTGMQAEKFSDALDFIRSNWTHRKESFWKKFR